MQILQNLGRAAIDAGLLVIMDAKRGDIGSTSTAYASWLDWA
jgi:orotidine-5'-phosphate decarboxylase